MIFTIQHSEKEALNQLIKGIQPTLSAFLLNFSHTIKFIILSSTLKIP